MINLGIIRDLCKNKGITLKNLADDLKISQTGLSGMLKNNSTTLETLEKIAKYFNVSVGVFFGEKDFTPLKNSISETFKHDFNDILNFWALCEQNEKMLIQIVGFDYSTISQKTIDEVRLELPTNKQKEYDTTLKAISTQINVYINNIIDKLDDKPSIMFVKNMSVKDIKTLYDFGLISEEIKAFILQVYFKITIDWNKEPFINSFRRYVLQHFVNFKEMAVQMLLN